MGPKRYGFRLFGFLSNSSKDSEFGFEALNEVGTVKLEDRQLGGREHRCMRDDRRRVLCSDTVHCDETAAPAVSPTCCRSSADRARFCWSHRVGEAGRGRGGVGGNTACAIASGIGEDGLSFVDSVQQYRFGGRAVGVDGAWLSPTAAGAYPEPHVS
jgi:hypothetical protein